MLPDTFEEIAQLLLEKLSEQEIQRIKSQSKEDFLTWEHFGLGMWIRNEMFHRPDPKKDKCVYPYADPDTVSQDILSKFYDLLTAQI